MVSGRYFNKGVKSLDSPHVGHVVRETSDKIVVFGEGDDRYDIPKDKIRFAAANVLIDLPFHEIVKNYKVSREHPLPLMKSMYILQSYRSLQTWRPMKENIQSRCLTKVSELRMKSI